MVTFTVPEEIRAFIRSHQSDAYGAMFKASSETLKKLARDEEYIGGDTAGFFGVLHTWGRTLQFHPHIHYVVPGGALSSEDGRWHPSRADKDLRGFQIFWKPRRSFFLPAVRAMSKIYKAKFRDMMIKNGLFDLIPAEAWEKDWNVNVQATGQSDRTIRYLSRYVFQAVSSARDSDRVHEGPVLRFSESERRCEAR